MWMHLVEPMRWSSPPRGSGGTATRPRVSSAAAVWRGWLNRSRSTSGRAAEGGGGVSHPHRDRRDVVGVGAGEQPRGGRLEGRRGGGARGERLVGHADPPEGVVGEIRVVGHEQGHRLAHEADDVAGDRGLEVALGAGGGADAVRDDRRRGDVGRGEDGVDAGKRAGVVGVDRDQPRVGVGRAEDGGVEHAGDANVLHEAAGARDEPLAAQSCMRLADHRTPSIHRIGVRSGHDRTSVGDSVVRVDLRDAAIGDELVDGPIDRIAQGGVGAPETDGDVPA